MSEKRMAGDALRDKNFAARTKLSDDPEKAAERAAKVGGRYDVSGYSDKEISMALQGDSFLEDDYFRLTGKRPGGNKEGSASAPTSVTPPSNDGGSDTPAPVSPIPTSNDPTFEITPIVPGPGVFGGQVQNVQQDNDINQTIGDNNTVTNNVDNSVSQQNGFGSANLFKSRFMKEYDFFK